MMVKVADQTTQGKKKKNGGIITLYSKNLQCTVLSLCVLQAQT